MDIHVKDMFRLRSSLTDLISRKPVTFVLPVTPTLKTRLERAQTLKVRRYAA